MHENIKAVEQALTEMNVPFSGIAGFPDALIVSSHTFIRSLTPFNTESVSALCRDKAAVHTLLQGKVLMPKTDILFDVPTDKSLEFLYPCIVKMNRGEKGKNVYLVSNETEARSACEHIFNRELKDSDYIVLVQEYIKPVREIRAVISGGAISFVYDRDAVLVVPEETLGKISALSKTILETINLSWGALDFIESESGELYFLEANTHPSFEAFISTHGNRRLIDAYKHALSTLQF
jgi:glutathione synthase/RimK-type ligase-like ATP-grasp enzyme